MNLKELMTLGGNVTVSVSLDDLRKWHDELLAASSGATSPVPKPPIKEELLTRKEVLGTLGIDASTLWRWAKTGYLVPIRYGGQKRYRAADIRAIVEGKKNDR